MAKICFTTCSLFIDRIAYKKVWIRLITERSISIDRKKLGWKISKLLYTKPLIISNTKKLNFRFFPKNSIHICQGIFFNGFIKNVQNRIRKNKLKHFLLMEPINGTGLYGKLKIIFYFFLFSIWKKNINGVLAVGKSALKLYQSYNINRDIIYPFAYFLDDNISKTKSNSHKNLKFKFIFVGNLIKRKNILLLLKALSLLKKNNIFEFEIIGNGPEKKK